MKKPVLPRIAGLLVLYIAVFVILVMVQFTRQRTFAHHLGGMTISGHYGEDLNPADTNNTPANLEVGTNLGGVTTPGFAVTGRVSVFFGGMEFRMDGEAGEFGFLRPGGAKVRLLPKYLVLSDVPSDDETSAKGKSATVYFEAKNAPANSGGIALNFTALSTASGPELRIIGSFGDEFAGAELPYRPMRNARIRDLGNDQFTIVTEGITYSFDRSHPARKVLVLTAQGPAISYRAVMDKKGFSPADYVLSQAWTAEQYEEAITHWRDQLFSIWARTVPARLDTEDMVTAYVSEAIHRGNYRDVVARIPRSFQESSRRTYVSSVFFGRLDASLQSLVRAEQDRTTRLTALLSEKPLDFLREPHVFAESVIRGNRTFIDDGAAALAALDPEAIPPELLPAIFEGHTDWPPGDANPFDPFIEPALLLIAGGVRHDRKGAQTLFFSDGRADTEYNLRLGIALDRYARRASLDDWAALGRSLTLSVISLTDPSGVLPAAVTPARDGSFTAGVNSEDSGGEPVNSASLYHYLAPITYPRAVGITTGGITGWAWTIASAVEVRRSGDIADIAVSFPTGETHYMIIRGISPFSKIQIRGIAYRADPQFERYDSSGWAYSAEEQSLLLKIKHRDPVEHIEIFYTPAPPPPPPPVEAAPVETAAQPAGTAAGAGGE